MGHPLMRLFVGGLLGAAAGLVAGVIILNVFGDSLLGPLKGPGAGWAAIGLLLIFSLAGLVCGASGGVIRRPWWGGAVGMGICLLVVGGWMLTMTLVRNAEINEYRERLTLDREFMGRHPGEDRQRVIERYVAEEERLRARPRVSLLQPGAGLFCCGVSGIVGGWIGRRLWLTRVNQTGNE